MDKLKVVMLSDTYGLHEQVEVPDGDVIIHAGNFSPYGEHHGDTAYKSFIKWFTKLPHKHKIFAPGKDDSCSYNIRNIYKMLNDNSHFIHNNDVQIDTTVIQSAYESSYNSYQVQVPVNWIEIFKQQQEIINRLEKSWSEALSYVNILITNHAPWGILDNGKGCQVLAERVKKSRPDFHVFSGTCAEYGITKLGNTTYINASICKPQKSSSITLPDGKVIEFHNDMVVTNKPIVLEVETFKI